MGFKQTRLRIRLRTYAWQQSVGQKSADNTVVVVGEVSTGDHPPKFNWRQAIKEGRSATTELHGLRYYRPKYKTGFMRTLPPTSASNSRNIGGCLHAPSMDYATTVSGSLLTRAQSRAVINLAKSVRKQRTQFQSGVFTGEIRETLQLFKRPVAALRDAVDDIYKTMRRISNKYSGSKTKVRRGLEVARDSWLEWSLAIKPLANDAEAAAQAVASLNHKRTWDLFRCIGEGKAAGVTMSTALATSNISGVGQPNQDMRRFVLHDIEDVKVRYLAVIKTNSGLYRPSPKLDTFGISMFEFLPTVWELIPRSFLVDYFVNAGDLITAWSLRFVNFSFVVGTTRQTRERRGEHVPYQRVQTSSSPVQVWEVGGGGLTLKATRVDRLSNPELGFPLPEFTIPGMGTKFLNIAALASVPTLKLDRKIIRY